MDSEGARKQPRRDAAIIVAAILVVLGGALFAHEKGGVEAFFRLFHDSEKTVRVREIRVDHQQRAFVDTVFTRSVAGKQLGEVITAPPVSIKPSVNGVWRWYANNVLRFEPSGELPMASEFKLIIDPAKLVAAGDKQFAGDTEFTFRTDDFLVRRVTWSETPAENSSVALQGEVEFNYSVRPEMLAPRISLRDGSNNSRIDLLTTYASYTVSFRTPPIRKEKAQRNVSIVIGADVAPADGNVTLGHEFVQSVPIGSRDKLVVRGMKASPGERESVIRIELSSPVTAAAAEPKLTVTPPAKYRIDGQGNELVLTGKFLPGHNYNVTLREGLLATDSALLQEAWKSEVAMADLEPKVDFQSEGMFLSASGYRTLAIESINVAKVHLTVERVYRNNLFFFLHDNGYSSRGKDAEDEMDDTYEVYSGYGGGVGHVFGDTLAEKDLNLGDAKNKRVVTTVQMDPLVSASAPGLYKVSLRHEGDENGCGCSSRWLLITDVGIVVKRSREEMLVWTSSFKDLSPQAGASITLLSDQNQTLARGETDGRGFVTLRDLKENARPFLLLAQRGNDFSFLILGNSRVDTSPFDVGGDSGVDAGYSAFLYGERNLYRPGEKAEGVVVLRDGSLRAPPKMPVVLRHKDPEGADRGSFRVETDAAGVATFELPLADYAKTGGHTLEALVGKDVIGQWSFQVEEFVPDRIKVGVEPWRTGNPACQKAKDRQDCLSYTVSAAYLFGAPAASLPVQTKVRLVPAPFVPKGFDEFAFGNNSRKFDPRELSSEESTLDVDGRKDFNVVLPQGLAVPASLQAVITAHVQEQGGRGVSALARVPLHPYPYYIGVRRVREPEGGRAATFEFVAVSSDGREVPASALRAEFFQDRWHTVLRQTSNGGYNYESTRDAELVKTLSIAAGKSRGRISYTPPDWGSYRVVVTDPLSLASSELEFDSWYEGRGYSPWAMRNPGRLELTLDRNDFAAGDSATLTIKSPFAGKALVTIERDRVYDTRVIELTGNSGRVSIPIPAEARPNAYVTATVIRAAGQLEPGEAGRAFGAVRVDVDRIKNQLPPKITAVDEMRSGRKLNIDVKTSPGARLTVAAVDEGILQLIAQKAPDPFGYFYRQRALDVATHDIFALLLPEVKPKGNALAGGSESGEGIAQFLSTEGIRRAKPVAYWSGVVSADGAGNAHVTFDIPEFQGAVRVTAVALDGGRFGSSEKTVRVHDPLVLMPTLPRFLATGDVVNVPVTLRNDSARRGRFTITVRTSGAVAVRENGSQQIDIEKGREATLLFPITASQSHGEARLMFAAEGNGEKASASGVLPVQAPLPAITDEAAGPLTSASLDLPAVTPGRFRPDSVQRELIVSALPIVQLRGRLNYLVHYPYGCVEQTTSSAFPLLYLADIAEEIDGGQAASPVLGSEEADRRGRLPFMVRAAIRRLATMQTSGGGFSMWPYGEQVNTWGTVYATHFLVEARRAGYMVESNVYDGALAYVAKLANAQAAYDHEGLRETVYALYVLGRARKPELGTMDYIRTKHLPELSSDMRAMLAAAYAGLGNQGAVQQLLAAIEQDERIDRFTGGSYASPMRNRALVLLALLDASPNDARLPKLVDRLTRDAVADPWYTTQESAMVLLAIGQYAKRQYDVGPFRGTVTLDGKAVGTFGAKTARFTKLGSTGKLRIAFEGKPSGAYYSLRTRGIPTTESFHPSAEGLKVTRRFMTRAGVALPSNEVKQGELVVIETTVESTAGEMQNVVLQDLLPAGLEVENRDSTRRRRCRGSTRSVCRSTPTSATTASSSSSICTKARR
jgi:uncharacterized protein YfaS (alpha-2-macroglobulin family)